MSLNISYSFCPKAHSVPSLNLFKENIQAELGDSNQLWAICSGLDDPMLDPSYNQLDADQGISNHFQREALRWVTLKTQELQNKKLFELEEIQLS